MKTFKALLWFAVASSSALGAISTTTSSCYSQEKGLPDTATTALDRYVASKDPSYMFRIVERREFWNCNLLRLHQVSQTWQNVPWKHVVWIVQPKSTKEPISDKAILLISGGSWEESWPEDGPATLEPSGQLQILARLATATHSIGAMVQNVPLQPQMGGKREDELIAETFKQFLLGKGEDWPLLLPMVKSAVRTMDSVQTVVKDELQIDIKSFTVTGASKRGWTTWLTSAVDPRVSALAPMVIDMLNMPVQMQYQLETWGKYSEEIGDYTALSLQKYLSTPGGIVLQNIVDPYRYLHRIKQPKLLIFGSNDRYWPIDAAKNYWSEVSSPKLLLYVPNKGHDVGDPKRLVGSLAALHNYTLGVSSLPKFRWIRTESKDKTVSLILSDCLPDDRVHVWTADSATKDFRDSTWTSTPAVEIDDPQFGKGIGATLQLPSRGSIAYFAEVVSNQVLPSYFSTNVYVEHASSALPRDQ